MPTLSKILPSGLAMNSSTAHAASLFLESMFIAKPNKKIDECYDYIISQAKKRGDSVVCMSDDEVFGLAVHYYDEDNIKVNKQSKSKVVVPKQPEKQKELTLTVEKSKPEQVAPNKRKGKKKEIPSGQFLLFEDL